MRNFKITVNGTSYDVAVEEVGSSTSPATLEDKTQAVAQPKPQVPLPSNGEKVTAPMPGTIVAIKASNGATVKKGELLFTLEAMKMENDIVSPKDGIITIGTSQGANVNTGDTLATIA